MSEPRTPAVTADLAVLGNTALESARLRDQHVWPVIVDANVLIEDVLWNSTPREHPSALWTALAVGTVRLLGKPDVLDEALEHLPEAGGARDMARVRRLLASHYVARLRLVDTKAFVIPDADGRLAAVAAADPDDEDSARLARLLDPSILLTRDHHLTDHGFGVWYEPGGVAAPWTAAAFTLYDRSFQTQATSAGIAAVKAITLPALGIASLARAAYRHPRLAGGLALAAGIGLWLSRDSPAWNTAADLTVRGIGGLFKEIAERNEGRMQASLEADHQLAAFRVANPGPGMPEAVLARILAIAPARGLSAAELYEITGRERAVRPILLSNAAFVGDASGRWHLGRRAAVSIG